MKKLFTVLAMALIVCSTAMAQDEKKERKEFSQEEMIQHQTDRLAEQLSLTDEQKAAVLELNTKYASKFQGMRPRPQGDRTQQDEQKRPSKEEMEKMRTEREESQKAYNEELKTILTADQYTKYEEMQKKMRAHGFGRGGGPRGGRPGGFGGHRDNFGSDNGNNFGQDNATNNEGSDNNNE